MGTGKFPKEGGRGRTREGGNGSGEGRGVGQWQGGHGGAFGTDQAQANEDAGSMSELLETKRLEPKWPRTGCFWNVMSEDVYEPLVCIFLRVK